MQTCQVQIARAALGFTYAIIFFTVGTYLRYIHKGLKLRDNTKGLERPRDHGVLIFFRTSTGDFTEGMTWTLRAAVSCTKKKP